MTRKNVALMLLVCLVVCCLNESVLAAAENEVSNEMDFERPEEEEGTDCVSARHRCLARETCKKALITVTDQCATVAAASNSGSSVDHCPAGCRNALAVLLQNEHGAPLLHCRCQGHEVCLAVRHRLEQTCRPEVTLLLRQLETKNAPVSCRIAEAVCSSDVSCSTALEYHHSLCQKAFRGQFCTTRCKNSYEILYSQEKAEKLKDCHCEEGTDANACNRRRKNAAELCELFPQADNALEDEITQLVALEDNRDMFGLRLRPVYKIQTSNGYFSRFPARSRYALPATPSSTEEDSDRAPPSTTSATVIIRPAWMLLFLGVNLPLFCLLFL
ncbi:hypothetical protein BV898_03512 [Hypsibius exemplaris]|uniref:GDNF/GAS1 domain-containing protein n=1 Tax=Hypsibius exemplaris TaxID=2072580 RepID=A0A1W0X5C4_HYPEX|nr:hypothetical protein BV898_03512 [Hypsibius exemplaris]